MSHEFSMAPAQFLRVALNTAHGIPGTLRGRSAMVNYHALLIAKGLLVSIVLSCCKHLTSNTVRRLKIRHRGLEAKN